jgi:hypothetical protein
MPLHQVIQLFCGLLYWMHVQLKEVLVNHAYSYAGHAHGLVVFENLHRNATRETLSCLRIIQKKRNASQVTLCEVQTVFQTSMS